MKEPSLERAIKKVWKSRPTLEGAGVHLRRVFGFHELSMLDPFLLLDDFRSENPLDYEAGFPWHPHRGIETITYVLEGEVEHGDSMGNRGIIGAGDVQWMTAGSGIIHQEMPKGNRKKEMFGFQLWANLPAQSKMIAPRYQEFSSKQIPVVQTKEGARVHVICGEVEGQKGPVTNVVIQPEFLDVELPAGKTFTREIDPSHTVFAYVIEGEGYFDCHHAAFSHQAFGENYFDMEPPCVCRDGTFVLYGEGSSISVFADKNPVRFLLISGKPIKEPVKWYGPIVMNTQAELEQAFKEYEQGTFIKT